MDTDASAIEGRMNEWLGKIGSPSIIKTETVVTAITEKPNDRSLPCLVVTVWYEPPESN